MPRSGITRACKKVYVMGWRVVLPEAWKKGRVDIIFGPRWRCVYPGLWRRPGPAPQAAGRGWVPSRSAVGGAPVSQAIVLVSPANDNHTTLPASWPLTHNGTMASMNCFSWAAVLPKWLGLPKTTPSTSSRSSRVTRRMSRISPGLSDKLATFPATAGFPGAWSRVPV